MKKILICIIFIATLSGCTIFESSTTSRISNYDINANYNLNAEELQVGEISEEDSGIYVASKSMQATVEITCIVSFSYTRTYATMMGTQTQTVTDQVGSQGTAFFINEDGYLMTNAHVISTGYEDYKNYREISRSMYINYAESTVEIDVTEIARDESLDLAILKTKSQIENQQYLAFFDVTDPTSDEYNLDQAIKLYYGETVYVVGNAYGYGISITKGVISAPVRYFANDDGTTTQAIQTDAAINSGNSGGPLLNKYCYVLGINSFKLVTSGVEGLGFAIPSNVIMDYIDGVDENINYYYTSERSYSPTIMAKL